MLYITGDTHSTQDKDNLAQENMELCCLEQKAAYSAITAAIVLGDFGLSWHKCIIGNDGIHPSERSERNLLKWYNQKPFKILALMGNHDNYDMLGELPQVEMFGQTVLQVSSNIFYLIRGNIYQIEGKSFLVLGGASSGITANPRPHENWWPQEVWSAVEEAACLAKIEKHGRKFDYVLSHTGPSAGIMTLASELTTRVSPSKLLSDQNVVFNNKIDSLITYKKWFFGHWHSDLGYKNLATAKYIPLCHEGALL